MATKIRKIILTWLIIFVTISFAEDIDEESFDEFDLNSWIFSDNSTQPEEIETRTKSDQPNTERVIIGILAHEHLPHHRTDPSWTCRNEEGRNKAYVTAQIVKFAEMGGSRVVPIIAAGNETYLREMFQSVNGLIFPGGLVSMETSDYARAGKFLYDLAVQENDRGIYFPIWGECLGFQFILYTAGGSSKSQRTKCKFHDKALSLNFTPEAGGSRLYEEAGSEIRGILSSQRVAAHDHGYCVGVENFKKFEFKQEFRILTTNYDEDTQSEFVSSVEATNYPFYGFAFLPEINNFVFDPSDEDSLHSFEAIKVAQYLAMFLVNEARKNNHSFVDSKTEYFSLIYNYQPSCYSSLYFLPLA